MKWENRDGFQENIFGYFVAERTKTLATSSRFHCLVGFVGGPPIRSQPGADIIFGFWLSTGSPQKRGPGSHFAPKLKIVKNYS